MAGTGDSSQGPVDIEELRGLAGVKDETIEQLGLQLMTLARKVFPSLGEKGLDWLLNKY